MEGDFLSFLLMFGAGAFTILGAVLDWNWFMNNGRARFFVAIFGRTGTRIFYVLLGLFLMGLSVLFLAGQ